MRRKAQAHEVHRGQLLTSYITENLTSGIVYRVKGTAIVIGLHVTAGHQVLKSPIAPT